MEENGLAAKIIIVAIITLAKRFLSQCIKLASLVMEGYYVWCGWYNYMSRQGAMSLPYANLCGIYDNSIYTAGKYLTLKASSRRIALCGLLRVENFFVLY